MIIKNSTNKAGITVFLSLSLLLITALLGTMVEVTRAKVCLIHGRRTVKTAVDSLMTEYSRPLYKEYHLFFLEDTGKSFEQSIAEYAGDTMNPESRFLRATDLYDGILNDIQVTDKKYMGDEEGNVLKGQVLAYMKRKLVSDIVNKWKDSADMLEGTEDSAKELELKVKEEKEAAKSSQKMLELMKLIDGVECSGGKVSGQKYFMKMFYFGEKRAEHFGITEPLVWDTVKDSFVNVEKCLNQYSTDEKRKNQWMEQIQKAMERGKKALRIAEELKTEPQEKSSDRKISSVLRSNIKILEDSLELLKGSSAEENKAELERLWKMYDSDGIQFDYNGIGEKGGAENPMDCFSEAVSGGLLNLVVKNPERISDKAVQNPDHYRKLYDGNEEEKEDYTKNVQDFASKEEVDFGRAAKDIASVCNADILMYEYMKEYFSSAKKVVGQMKKRLDYEWEYILCGKESDRENLEQIVNRMVLIRTVINASVIFASPEKREKTHAAALAVVGFTGMEPLIRFTQTVFTILWGMSESLVDVAALLQGKRVPFIKTAETMTVQFSDLYQISNSYIMGKVEKMKEDTGNSIGYEEYMMLFLAANEDSSTCCRMMDLMEWNIKDNYFKGFNLGICVDSFRVKAGLSFSTKFFRLPFIQKIIDRELNYFHEGIVVNSSYTGN